MTNNDLQQIDSLIKKGLKGVVKKDDLKGFATKKDFTSLESKLRKDIKNDIDNAVVQVIGAVDKTVGHLAQRTTRIEKHLDLPTFE